MKNKKIAFFVAIVVGFVVFNWLVFEKLNKITENKPEILEDGSIRGGFQNLSGEELDVAREEYRHKIDAQNQFVYVGNGVLVLLSLGGYFLFLKEQKS